MKQEAIFSPLTGTAVPMAEVPDEVFSRNLMGQGVAVIPTDGVVVAPIDGVVTVTTPTNHALCLRSDGGLDLLIHLGLDTVSLGGRGFVRRVEKGQRVCRGDKILEFDLELCKREGIRTISPCVVLSGEEFPVCRPHLGPVRAGESLLMLVSKEEPSQNNP